MEIEFFKENESKFYSLNPKASLSSITEFEIENNVKIPTDYKFFLSKYSNGISLNNNSRHAIIGNELKGSFLSFNSLQEIQETLDIMEEIESEWHYYFRDCLVPISYSSGGSCYCIGASGKYKNKVVFLCHELYDGENDDNMIELVTDSFKELIESLSLESI